MKSLLIYDDWATKWIDAEWQPILSESTFIAPSPHTIAEGTMIDNGTSVIVRRFINISKDPILPIYKEVV